MRHRKESGGRVASYVEWADNPQYWLLDVSFSKTRAVDKVTD